VKKKKILIFVFENGLELELAVIIDRALINAMQMLSPKL
jgi:hypothetical protein